MNYSQTTDDLLEKGEENVSSSGANIVTVASLVIVLGIVALLYFLAQVVQSSAHAAANEARAEAQIVERLRPVAGFEMGATAKGPKTGQEVYDGLCTSCHAAGVSGAPKMGDSGAWGSRIAQGEATLFKHALEGFTGSSGNMPAKGGNPGLSDLEVERAVVFMANSSGGSLAEPVDPNAAQGDSAETGAPAIPAAK